VRLFSPARAAALIVLSTALGVYYVVADSIPVSGLWTQVYLLWFLVIPAVFGFVWLALPAWAAPLRQLLTATVVFAAAAVVLQATGASPVANFAKLGAMTLGAWCFLRFFEELSWVVLVAVIVPFVDSYSVWRGPTNTIVNKHVQVFDALSFTFPVPGIDAGAKLGLPDLLFFALYLGAAARWRLRPGWTWLCLTASIGGTIALTTVLDVNGLPALPLLSVGFLLPNADLLWRAVRGRSARDPRRSPT